MDRRVGAIVRRPIKGRPTKFRAARRRRCTGVSPHGAPATDSRLRLPRRSAIFPDNLRARSGGALHTRRPVDLVVQQFPQTAAVTDIAILVYCVMPDHVHLLLEGLSDNADLITFMKDAKQQSAWQSKQHFRKRLLVERPEDYPYWGSSVYSREEILRFIGYASHRR